MADINDIKQALVDTLPRTGGGGHAINVGFADETDIDILLKGIAKLWDKQERTRLAALDTRNRRSEENLKKERSEFLKQVFAENRKTFTETLEQSKKENGKNQKALIYSIVDSLTKYFKSYLNTTESLAKFFQDFDRTGVSAAGGLNQLKDSAIALGMSQTELLGALKKTSPLLARLSGSGKDSLAMFSKSVANINKELLLSNEERVAAFENVMSRLTPSDLQVMNQDRLNKEIAKTAERLKEMSYMTGKTVEALAEEQKIRDRNTRVGAMRQNARFKGIFEPLLSLGYTEEQIIALITGGMDSTLSDSTRIWAARSDNRALSQRILRGIASNEDFTASDWAGDFKQQNKALLENVAKQVNANSGSLSNFMAAGLSGNLLEATLFSMSGLHDYSKNKPGYSDTDKNAISKAYEVARKQNTKEFLSDWAKAGGVTGVNAAMTIELGYYNFASYALQQIVDKLGFMSAILMGVKSGLLTFGLQLLTSGLSGFGGLSGHGSLSTRFSALRRLSRMKMNHALNWLGESQLPEQFSKHRKLWGGLGVATAGAGLMQILGSDHTGRSMGESATEGGLYGAVSGAIIGSSITNSAKGMAIGAIVGGASGAIIALGKNMVDNGIEVNGEALFTSLKQITAEAVTNPVIATILGAAIGGKVAGWKGALYGAFGGAGIGIIGSTVKWAMNKWFGSGDDEEEEKPSVNQYKQPQVSQPENITQQSAVMMPQTVIKANSTMYDSSDYWGEMIRLQRAQVDQGKTMIDWTKYGQTYRENQDTKNRVQQSIDTSVD